MKKIISVIFVILIVFIEFIICEASDFKVKTECGFGLSFWEPSVEDTFLD